MKKRIILMVLALVCLLTLSACGCKHETWLDADCETPKTCADCGETEGAPLGHVWQAATCETPKTCEVCGKTEGEATGHSWADVTCEAPKTCTTCGLTEGEPLGHDWQAATTEAPETCTTCGATQGEKIITDERFTTAATAQIQGKWVCSMDVTGDMMDLSGLETPLKCQLLMDLGNDGTLTISVSVLNEEDFIAALNTYMVDTLYSELAAAGLDKEAADAAMEQTYGMNVTEYADYAVKAIDFDDLIGTANISGVYYVADDQLYVGDDWDSDMEPTSFILHADTLTLEEDLIGNGSETTVLTRYTE